MTSGGVTGAVTGEVTVSAVRELREGLHALVRDFDPRCCDGETAKRFVGEFARIERLAGAGKTLAIGQVERTGSWAHGGSSARSSAEWLAAQAGLPIGEAIRTTETAKLLDDLPATEAALREGGLSGAQANEIAGAAAVAPQAEKELLGAAKHEPFKALRNRARKAKAGAQDEANRAARQHALRRGRRFTDDEGMRRYEFALTPEQAAIFEPTWDRFIERLFAEARAAGRRESHEAYAADALVAMAQAVAGNGSTPTTAKWGAGVHALLLIDAAAFHRGYSNPGETCEVAGIGPIDVAAAKRLFGDAIVDILVTEGVDVRTVAHAGRAANRRQKAALLAGWECEVRGCIADHHLEIDHIAPWCDTKRTAIEQLGPKCHWHHYLKTHKGWTDGPKGVDGKRDLIPPAGAPPPPDE